MSIAKVLFLGAPPTNDTYTYSTFIHLFIQAQVGAESQLVSVLRRFLSLVDDARVLILTTADGTELLTGTVYLSLSLSGGT